MAASPAFTGTYRKLLIFKLIPDFGRPIQGWQFGCNLNPQDISHLIANKHGSSH